jgi:hypothetical protein
MIQIIANFDEILNHILNMNWLYHFNYNWKVWLIWFHKKHLDKFFIQTNINVLKKKFVENLISFERRLELCWRPLYQNPFYMFQNVRCKKRKIALKIYQNIPQNKRFSCLKQPPHSVLSPSNRNGYWLSHFWHQE